MNNNSKKTLSLDDLIKLDQEKSDNNGDITAHEEEGQDVDNKFYLPVLSMNESDFWPSLPKSQRSLLTKEKLRGVCTKSCCGHEGIYSGCCRFDPDDLENLPGPISEKWIKSFIKNAKKKGQILKREDIIIDFEEGQIIGNAFFGGNKLFKEKALYPILRFQAHGPRFACKFLNLNSGACSIYNQRPDKCKHYYCEYLKRNFLIKTDNSTNTYKMIDDRRWQCTNCGTYNKHSLKNCNDCQSSKEK